jgi:DNA-binding response OmpR family regulator
MNPVQNDPTVLIVDADTFEAGYVSSMLEDLKVNILYHADAGNALRAISVDSVIHAAIVGWVAESADVIRELKSRNIPYLLLLPADRKLGIDTSGVSILVKPFAAYQVADWVSKTVAMR